MAQITASDVAKLRKTTGAGLMDCKSALEEANGDFDAAIDIFRKKGQKVASKRAEREASEGCVIAKTAEDNSFGVLVSLNCETDFVAKNNDFVKLTTEIADAALAAKPNNLEELLALPFRGVTIGQEITTQTGVIGEKLELSYYEKVDAPFVMPYIHQGNKLAVIVGFSKEVANAQVAKDVAMQVAAMAPLAVNKDGVDAKTIEKEIEIGKEIAMNEGKPAEMAEKIAIGRLGKFFRENTLLEQQFVKDNKKTIAQYIAENDKNLSVTAFKRFTLNV
jgi:elongation factor Ts